MAVTQITYARLYNLGNYENERFEVTVTVEDFDVPAAFSEARDIVDVARVQAEGDRRAEADRVQQEQEAKRERIRLERQAELEERQRQRDTEEQRRQAQPDLDF